ncbi:hypothetical protein AURDEDRAFT_171075 [Auricularia subglabra TFB-10046 SS5]|nr:hypothetical protein AURDEDRAFT_171075 [Auricularia subglabra TFB-10046 SS5]
MSSGHALKKFTANRDPQQPSPGSSASRAAGGKGTSRLSKASTSGTSSRELVYDPSGAIIVPDSDDDTAPQPSKFIPPKLKGQATHAIASRLTPLSLESKNRKRRVEQTGEKRLRDVDDDEEESAHGTRLREKNHGMQAKNELVTRQLKAAQKEVKRLKGELETKHSTMEDLLRHVECEICLETLWKPWAFSDCGHIFCQTCLMSMFKQEKFKCPTCRTRVRHRPVEAYAFKSMVRALAGPAPDDVDIQEGGRSVWNAFWPSIGP